MSVPLGTIASATSSAAPIRSPDGHAGAFTSSRQAAFCSRPQSIAVVVSAVLIPLVIWGWFAFEMRANTLAAALAGELRAADALGVHTAKLLEAQAFALDLLDREAGERLCPDLRSDVRTRDFMRFVARSPQVEALWILNPDGFLCMANDPTWMDDRNRAFRGYFSGAQAVPPGHYYVDRGFIGLIDGRPTFTVAKARIKNGAFNGILLASVNSADLVAYWQRTIDNKKTQHIALFQENGAMIVRSWRPFVVAPDPAIERRTATIWQTAPDGTAIRESAFDGSRRVSAWHTLPDWGVVVTSSIEEEVALAPWRRSMLMKGCVAAVLSALFGTWTWFMLRQQARLEAEVRIGREIQEQLRVSEARLRDFAMTGSEWFWEQDAELRFIDIGMNAHYPQTDWISKIGRFRWDMVIQTESADFWEAHKRDLLARRPIRDFRFRLYRPDGTLQHISISGTPVYDSAGAFIGYRGTGRGITADIEAAEALRAAKEHAEQAEALLRDAVNSISEGFVIFDQADRLVICNEAYRQLYPAVIDRLIPGGITHEEIVLSILEADGFPDARGRKEEWLTERLRHRREAAGSFEQRTADGRWILLTDRRMANGGLAGLRMDITRIKQADAALRESEARLDRAQEIADIGSWELNVATGRYHWSKQMYRIRGVSPEDFVPTFDAITRTVHPDDILSRERWYDELIAGREQPAREGRIIRPNGEVRVVRIEGRPEVDANGIVCRISGTDQDVTERRWIERQLAQAQKMEAIGNLTGGLAHDFNNGLGIVIGNLDLLARLVKAAPAAMELCQEARDGATRCAELIRQLLAFSRRQPLRPQPTDVNALVEDIARLLGRTLGEDIALTLHLDAALRPALADPVQLEAAIVNLANNARDAMPAGGRLMIATLNIELDADYVARSPEARAGSYVLIEVSDTGVGIPSDVIGQVFEPFFTTKQPGSGTGLGLSMVFGFVKQSGGHVTVSSEPGNGSSFRIYLPQAHTEGVTRNQPADESPVEGGDETVLLVEDNDQLRKVMAQQLTSLGYRVLEAGEGAAALKILSAEPTVELLFTDVVMPGAVDGIELACQAKQRWPTLAILVTSGFPGKRLTDERLSQHGFGFLSKPYRRRELARAARAALARTRHRP